MDSVIQFDILNIGEYQMQKHLIQEFNGVKFYKKREGYYKADFVKFGKTVYMHRYVWEYSNGEIPDGHHVHHIDGDKANNALSNLELISSSDHSKLHNKEREEKTPMWWKDGLEKARKAAVHWHKSEAGLAFHKELGKNSWLNRESVEWSCLNCNKPFTALVGAVKNGKGYCRNYCKTAYRNKSGVDNEKRQCVSCNTEFECNKYVKKKTCSKSCASLLLSKTKKEKNKCM